MKHIFYFYVKKPDEICFTLKRDGQEWRKVRLALNPLFLGKGTLQPCVSLMNKIANDFAQNLLGQTNGNAHLDIQQLETSLNSYIIEGQQTKSRSINQSADNKLIYFLSSTVLGAFLFGNRMGCVKIHDQNKISTESLLTDDKDQLHIRFQHAVKSVFVETAKMQFLPAKLAQKWNLPVWKRFVEASSTSFELGMKRALFKKKKNFILSLFSCHQPVFLFDSKKRMK